VSKLFSWLGGKSAGKTPERALDAIAEARTAEAEGDVKRATRLYEEAVGIYHSSGMQVDEAGTHLALAQMLVRDSAFTPAFESFDAGVSLYRKLGSPGDLATALHEAGNAEYAYSNPQQAEKYLLESRSLFEKLGDGLGVASVQKSLGTGAFHNDDFESAIEFLSSAQVAYIDVEKSIEAAICLVYLAACFMALQDVTSARRLYTESLALYQGEYPDSTIVSLLSDIASDPFSLNATYQINELLNTALLIYSARADHSSQSADTLSGKRDASDSRTRTGATVLAKAGVDDLWRREMEATLTLAALAYSLNRIKLAEELFNTCIAAAEQRQDTEALTSVLSYASSQAYLFQRNEVAARYYAALIPLLADDVDNLAIAYQNAARIALARRIIADAMVYCEEALELTKRGKSISATARNLSLYAAITAEAGETVGAARLAKESIALCGRAEDYAGQQHAMAILGHILLIEDPDAANALLMEVVNSEAAAAVSRVYACMEISRWQLMIGEIAAAYEFAIAALVGSAGQLSAGSSSFAAAQERCGHIATLWGDIETAVILYSRSTEIVDRLGIVRAPDDQDQYEANMKALRNELQPNEFDAAWVEGRNISIEDIVAEAQALLEDIEPEGDTEENIVTDELDEEF